jgi:hypothetical protein
MGVCKDYGDRPGCLGTPDEQWTMRFDDLGEEPILWCSYCGPKAHALNAIVLQALHDETITLDDMRAAIDDAEAAQRDRAH